MEYLKIKSLCLNLSVQEREDLYNSLRHSLEVKSHQDYFSSLKEKHFSLFNLTGFESKTRKEEYVLARSFICYQMFNDGYKELEISKVTGINRCTVYSLLNKMGTILRFPGIYGGEIEKWKTFHNLCIK